MICHYARCARAALLLMSLVWGAAAYAQAASETLSGDAVRGKALYQACSACHSLDDNDIGPKHRGVVGRRAGTVPDYTYSPALKASGLTWDPANLDRWLTNPQALVPGTKMYFLLANAQSRADVIAYLTQQK
jgi:cytochrome c